MDPEYLSSFECDCYEKFGASENCCEPITYAEKGERRLFVCNLRHGHSGPHIVCGVFYHSMFIWDKIRFVKHDLNPGIPNKRGRIEDNLAIFEGFL